MVGSSPTSLFSAYFGALELEEAAILCFPQGLPGFESEHRFAAIQIPEQQPLVYLQSVATPGLCLLTFPVHVIHPGFCLSLSKEDRETLDVVAENEEEIVTLAIIAADNHLGPTANLAAPLAINLRNSLAVQSLQPDPALSYQHPLTPADAVC